MRLLRSLVGGLLMFRYRLQESEGLPRFGLGVFQTNRLEEGLVGQMLLRYVCQGSFDRNLLDPFGDSRWQVKDPVGKKSLAAGAVQLDVVVEPGSFVVIGVGLRGVWPERQKRLAPDLLRREIANDGAEYHCESSQYDFGGGYVWKKGRCAHLKTSREEYRQLTFVKTTCRKHCR